MTDDLKAHIFVVDDDPCILDAISLNLNNARFGCTCFESADDCLERLQTQKCDLIITDVRMPGRDGMELLTEVKRLFPWLPVIVMTSYGDIPLAVKALKTGAADFVEKPLEWERFLVLVDSTLQQNDLSNFLKGKSLTKTEKIVLRMILHGHTNKEIAHIMGRSIRTIEVHRSHIMRKLGVDNVVELVKRSTAMDLGGSE